MPRRSRSARCSCSGSWPTRVCDRWPSRGPAFVELGVRAPKESHDVDLLTHPADRAVAAACLTGAGWFVLGYDLPPEIDDIIYSTTYGHDMLPCRVDVHHVYPGLLAGPGLVLEALWSERTSVPLAGAQVMAPAAEHALIIEALHRLCSAEEQQWGMRRSASLRACAVLSIRRR